MHSLNVFVIHLSIPAALIVLIAGVQLQSPWLYLAAVVCAVVGGIAARAMDRERSRAAEHRLPSGKANEPTRR